MTIDSYALSYSTPINTGFRAKFAIANNSPYMVFIHHAPDELNTTTSQLVLWTHEIVAQSDPEIIEKLAKNVEFASQFTWEKRTLQMLNSTID